VKSKYRQKKKVIRVFIVDDHPYVRWGLRSFLETIENIEVCGDADDAGRALTEIAHVLPDIVVLDITLNGTIDGIDLTAHLTTQFPKIAVIILSMHQEYKYADRAFSAGASAYITKTETTALLPEAIREVMRGRMFISEQMRAGAGSEQLPYPA
jgi:DNA-binding NarL/FixJ family response regulator